MVLGCEIFPSKMIKNYGKHEKYKKTLKTRLDTFTFLACNCSNPMKKQPSNLSVRTWVLGAIGVLAAGSVACKKKAEANNGVPSAMSVSSTDVYEQTLTILTWDDYFSEKLIEEFEVEHGIDVKFQTFGNLDEQEALLRSKPSEFDLTLTSGVKLADLIETQLIQPIQKALLPQFQNLDARFLGLSGDPSNEYSIPYMWGPTLIAYRADKISDPKRSWETLWDARYKGHVLMLNEPFDAYASALLSKGYDINSRNLNELTEATDRLKRLVDVSDARFVDIDEIRSRLLSGDCWITMTYSSDAGILAEENENISYFVPEEGSSLWLDSFVIPKEAVNWRQALLFLDFFCRPKVAARNSNELWCASAVGAAKEFLSDEIRSDPTIYLPDHILARCKFEENPGLERQEFVNRGMKIVSDIVKGREPNAASQARAVLGSFSDDSPNGGEEPHPSGRSN
jgi:spermidine/putrescine transport system substrate-binding protein